MLSIKELSLGKKIGLGLGTAALGFLLAACGEGGDSTPAPGQLDPVQIRAAATRAAVARATEEASQPLQADTMRAYNILRELQGAQGLQVFNYQLAEGQSAGKDIQIIFNNPNRQLAFNDQIISALDALFYTAVSMPDNDEVSSFYQAHTSFIMWDVGGRDNFGGVNPINTGLGANEVTIGYATEQGKMSVATVPYDLTDPTSSSFMRSFATGWAQAQTNGLLHIGPNIQQAAMQKELLSNSFGLAVQAAHQGISYEQYQQLMAGTTLQAPVDAVGDISGQRPTVYSSGIYSEMSQHLQGQPLFVHQNN